MPKPSWKLIVGEDGKVRTYAYSKRDMEFYNLHYEDNFEWEDELEYSGFGRGTSAAHLYFRSTKTHKEYQMFLTDFNDIVELLVKGKLSGTFTYCKRGMNYGVKFINK